MATRSRGYTSKTRLRGFKKICWVFVEQAGLPVFVRFRLDKQNPSSLLGICGTGRTACFC
jgi:hypothetical protein